MALDGKILARAKASLAEKRQIHNSQMDTRLRSVYARVPRVHELDIEIRSTMTELFGAALVPDGASLVEDIHMRNAELQAQRRSELIRAGFPDGYLDEEYLCNNCRDTGYDNMVICSCLMEMYKDEQRKSLSSLFRLGDETFDNFDISLYDDSPTPDTMISPRRTMDIIYETCVEYARKFGKKSMNLFFNGAPGLGKTFLSACIARVVADSGHSVVYDTASSVFAKFEYVKFSRAENNEDAFNDTSSEIKRCLECDLLILDDLGTEMTTAFTTSALYDIVNTRLITGLKTIVSSNLTLNELRRRYSEQIMSRLEGEYQVLTFRGEDIRKRRNTL